MALPVPDSTPTPQAVEPTPAVSQTPQSVEPTPLPQTTAVEPVATPTPGPTREPLATATPQPTATSTPKPAPTPKPTPTPTPEATPTPSPTPVPTPKPPPKPVPTPTPTPQATSTPVSTPKPSPTPTLEPLATPTPKAVEKKTEAARPTATPESKPKRSVLDEKPVRALEPRTPESRRPLNTAPVGRSRPTFDLAVRGDREIAAAVTRLENRWQRAIRTHSLGLLSSLLADDFVGTSSTGRIGSKGTLLNALRQDKNTYTSVEASNMTVRTAGDDTAVVTGITRESGTTPEGQRFKSARRFTDTWVKRNGRWRCIASQTTDL